MKYYLGIDASTSCTGFAIIHESGVLVYKDYVYTKDLKSKAQSFQEVYDIIYDKYEEVFKKMSKEGNEWVVGVEANCFGNMNVIMQLGIVLGIIHALSRQYLNASPLYITANNWRANIVCINNLHNYQLVRSLLKNKIADWAEQTFDFKLPKFPKPSDGEKYWQNTLDRRKFFNLKDDTAVDENGNTTKISLWMFNYADTLVLQWDDRVNDVSDAIAIAYALYKGWCDDRRAINIKKAQQDDELRGYKHYVATYKKKVDEWFKKWKKDKSAVNYKAVMKHIASLEFYLNKLKEKSSLLENHKKYYIIIKEIKEKLSND
ncbi:MAG: hypothetical protein HUJ52_04205 [Malacoplasma sp.]|nr:hypothetical protein [Malacoplasma sp.]